MASTMPTMPTMPFRLKNRYPKKPLPSLPGTIEVPMDATVEDAKKAIAQAIALKDYNRIGLYDPITMTTLKDRHALLTDIAPVVEAGELIVKDFGPQIPWRYLFVLEYIGPILIHNLIFVARPYIYVVPPFVYKNEIETPMTPVQGLLFSMFQMHFLKREFETLVVHKFSATTMPISNIPRNCAFYWLVAGLLGGLEMYMPGSLAARDHLGLLDYLGVGLFAVGEMCNGIVHLHLSSLRKQGSTEKGIPNCIGSSLVTCPNYMFEVMAWFGFILVSRSPSICAFILLGIQYMRPWSRDKEKALRKTFGDKYKPKRYTMLPGLI